MGRKNQVIKLLKTKPETNENGFTVQGIASKREICAKKKSVKRTEFYQAAASGMKPELVFVVWKREYENEPWLEYDGKVYEIIRTFETSIEDMELTCSAWTG